MQFIIVESFRATLKCEHGLALLWRSKAAAFIARSAPDWCLNPNECDCVILVVTHLSRNHAMKGHHPWVRTRKVEVKLATSLLRDFVTQAH